MKLSDLHFDIEINVLREGNRKNLTSANIEPPYIGPLLPLFPKSGAL